MSNKNGQFPHALEKDAEKLGRKCNFFFCDFVSWIIADCHKRKISKVFFLAREGEFFERIFKTMSLCQDYEIEYEFLHVSRLSTFLPSLHTFTLNDWSRFLNQYSDQNVDAFIHSLGIDYEETSNLLRKKGLQLEVRIEQQKNLFCECITDQEFECYVREKSAAAKQILLNYLDQKGLDNSPGSVAVVDIGWRGTIQDNLCYILPDKMIYGYYLGMIPLLNKQPANAVKQGFINTKPFAAALLKSHTQLEMICSSRQGSVIGYRKERNNVIVPVQENNTKDLFSWNNYTKYFQRGVISGIREGKSFKRQWIPPLFLLSLFPNKKLAQAFFMFRYSEQFGLGKDIDQSRIIFSWKPFFRVFKGKKYLKQLRLYLNQTMWPQGFLRIHGLSLLIPLYNLVLLFGTRRKRPGGNA